MFSERSEKVSIQGSGPESNRRLHGRVCTNTFRQPARNSKHRGHALDGQTLSTSCMTMPRPRHREHIEESVRSNDSFGNHQESAPHRHHNRCLRRIPSDRSRTCGEPQVDKQAAAQLLVGR